MSRKIALFLVVLAGGGVAIWQLLPSHSSVTTPEVSSVGGMSLFGYDSEGRTTWAIQAEAGEMKDDFDSELFAVSFRLLSEDSTDVLGGCDSMRYVDDQATMKGNVTLIEQGGISLVTDKAIWDTKKSEIRALHVTISVQSGSLVAPTFRYQTDDRFAEMSGGVQGLLYDSSPIVVSSDQADANKNVIHMDGNVRVEVRQETYTAKRLDYNLSDNTTTLSGSVMGAFSDGRITADELVINGNEIKAQGDVQINLMQGFFGESNGA
jgi:lipopolysaccharide assembly outer membrane protein LptD (OstA)